MATIQEAIANAAFNLRNANPISAAIAKAQIENANKLLEKGYDLHHDIEELEDQYGDIDEVPELEEVPVSRETAEEMYTRLVAADEFPKEGSGREPVFTPKQAVEFAQLYADSR